MALYSFVILLITGTYLALFFNASLAKVVYHGSYTKLDGVTMSEAYESALYISLMSAAACWSGRSIITPR